MSLTLQKKVCLLGAFAVGKTSLVSRFVKGIFSEKYLSTMGVKIDRKNLQIGDVTINMMLWDIHGEESNKKVPAAYMRGTAAYLLVVDGTRKSTIAAACELHERIRTEAGDIPFVVLLNKCDLQDEWQLAESDMEAMQEKGWDCFLTSACSGQNVDAAFSRLAEKLLP